MINSSIFMWRKYISYKCKSCWRTFITDAMESIFIIIATFSFASILFFFSLLWYYNSNKDDASFSLPKNWPVLGMTPSLLSNLNRSIYWLTEVLQQCGGTFLLKGPWLCKMELLFTADPNNVQHIMSKCHEKFHRGDDFNKIFDVLGDGIFNSDDGKWKYQRKIALSAFSSTRFRQSNVSITKDKVEKGLIPFLQRAYEEGLAVDLQHVFRSLISDITFMVLLGHDPKALSFNPPTHSLSEGIHEGEEAVFLRHMLPEAVWMLQRRLRVGKERKLSEIEEAVDSFFYGFIGKKREEVMQRMGENVGETDLVSLYIEQNYDSTPDHGFQSPDIFLRDTFVSFLLAGQDTVTSGLTWFFWLLIKHPKVEKRIREELVAEGFDISQLGDANKLVYLQASLLETLRLYPPVPFNHRTAKEPEVLPSGHRVKPWTKIMFVTYALGRMKSVWGEDCEEFKPERWITEQGTMKQEPSHKFFVFNSGPRICIGKEMSMMRLKAVVCSVLCHKYRFEVVEGHRVELTSSLVLQMKHGLKVKVYKTDD